MIKVEMTVERLVTCHDEGCTEECSVLITSDEQGYSRTPFCTGHAHLVFADWMVGV